MQSHGIVYGTTVPRLRRILQTGIVRLGGVPKLPLVTGLTVAIAGILVSHAMRAERVERIEGLIAATTAGLAASIGSDLTHATKVVAALASNEAWRESAHEPLARLLQTALGNFERVELLDPARGTVRRLIDGADRRALTPSKENTRILARARRTLAVAGGPVLAAPVDFDDGSSGFVVLASTEAGKAGTPAVLAVTFAADAVFGELPVAVAPEYWLAIRAGNRWLFRHSPGMTIANHAWTRRRAIDFPGLLGPWRVLVRPRASILGARYVSAPNVVLATSLVIALLLSLTLHQWRTLSLRGKELESTVERRTAELREMLEALRDENRARDRAQSRLAHVLELNHRVSAQLQPEQVKRAVVEGALTLTGAVASALCDVDAAGSITLAACASSSAAEIDTERILASARAAVAVDARDDHAEAGLASSHAERYRTARVRTRDGSLRAVLVLDYAYAASATDSVDEDQSALAAVAAQAATALDNASLYEAAETAREEAELAIASRDRFLAILGHELRNPLGSIRNALHVLKEGPDERTWIRMEEIADRQLAQLARLISDLFEASRLATGTLEVRRERFDLTALLRQLGESQVLQAYGSDLDVVAELPQEPVWIDGDRDRITQVVTNIMNNAAKYTPVPGTIELRLEHDAPAREARICVRDTGRGLEPGEFESLFDAFTRGTREGEQDVPGLGLGLNIARSIVQAHGGEIWATSPGPGRGSAFWIRLPASATRGAAAPGETAVDVSARAKPAANAPDTPGSRHARVLVVEDQGDAAEALVAVLELDGHQVDLARDGASALRMASWSHHDVIVCDIDLPEMDGYEVARRIRSEPDEDVPILVALTGYGDLASVERGKAAGFDHYLTKPLDVELLRRVLRDVHAV